LNAPTPYLASNAGCRISLRDTAGIGKFSVERFALSLSS